MIWRALTALVLALTVVVNAIPFSTIPTGRQPMTTSTGHSDHTVCSIKKREPSESLYTKTSAPNGGSRYVIQYATIGDRWSPASSSLMTRDRIVSQKDLPPACPQSGSDRLSDRQAQAEECLYLTIYTPRHAKPGSSLPVLFWIHGGSFVSGGSSQQGLDGSALSAFDRGMVVVVVQYRLGVLGLLPPTDNIDPNLGLKDIITALRFVQSMIDNVGGDRNRITVGGQSSGGQMVRALLASPDGAGLFRGAIIQSDPMTYGFAARSITETLRSAFYSSASGFKYDWSMTCSGKDLDCWRKVPIEELVEAQEQFMGYVANQGQIQGVPSAQVLRPTTSTTSLPLDFSKRLSEGTLTPNVPLLITTVHAEAGSLIQQLLPFTTQDQAVFDYAVTAQFDSLAASTILGTVPEYNLSNPDSLVQAKLKGVDPLRSMLVRLGTDAIWRCPLRDVATRWTRAGGRVWVGEWVRGKTYVSNKWGTICKGQVVCHEDDILPTFGQGDTGLIDDVLSRWSAFVHDLDPNPAGNMGGVWRPFDGAAQDVFMIGSESPDGQSAALECPDMWGDDVKYDWQLYS